jgi:aromatic-amino-acid transaminase
VTPTATERASLFANIPPFAGDPILSLHQEFLADPRPQKINLSIGIYFDDAGRIPVLSAVRRAEAIVVAKNGPKPYLPIEGAANFRTAVQELLFGAGHEALASGRVATIQSVGSSGGLTVGMRVIRRFFPDSSVYVSDPTWDNHRWMLEAAGFTIASYPYYDSDTGGVRFDAMLTTLRSAPARSVVLLHACCHNPTGADLSAEQWDALIPVLQERELIPYLDLAYQGFAGGIDADAYPVRAMASAGISFFIANSFSKSMSLYGERCGALSIVCQNATEADHMLGQMKYAVHRNYSSPPTHGGQVVATVLTEPELRAEWAAELDAMRTRILAMRTTLHAELSRRAPGRDFGYVLSQRGMFSYTGLSVEQVARLRSEHALYMMGSGRICVAGLNASNVVPTAAAIAAVL